MCISTSFWFHVGVKINLRYRQEVKHINVDEDCSQLHMHMTSLQETHSDCNKVEMLNINKSRAVLIKGWEGPQIHSHACKVMTMEGVIVFTSNPNVHFFAAL